MARIIVWVDKSNDGTGGLQPDELLEDTTSGPSNIMSPLNKDIPDRVQILLNKVVMLSSANGKDGFIDFYHEFKGHHLNWDKAGDLVTDTRHGHLYYTIVTDASNTNTELVGSYAYSRIKFIDN